MKTLTKMFLLSCWCLISVSFAKETLDEIKANQEQQLIQEKLEILESQNQTQTKETKEEQGSHENVLVQEKGLKEISVPPYSNDGIDKDAILEAKEAYLNSKGTTLEPLSIEELNKIGKEIKEEILAKGYTVQEYIDAVNADRISNEKEGAVSYETYLQGLNAKEQAIILEYVLQPVENTEGETVENTHINYKEPVENESVLGNPMQEKIDHYTQLHEDAAANFHGPTLFEEIEVAPQDGSRDGVVSATICGDSWAYETYWILLDTVNWWAYGSDGWVQHSAGSYGCEDWSATVPAGNYMFILGDSYGDGGGTADVSVNGELVGSVACSSSDALSPYSGLYEAALQFDVQEAAHTCSYETVLVVAPKSLG